MRLLDHYLGGQASLGRALVDGAQHHRGRGRVLRSVHGQELIAAAEELELFDLGADLGVLDLVRLPALRVLFVKEGFVKIEEVLGQLGRCAEMEGSAAVLWLGAEL